MTSRDFVQLTDNSQLNRSHARRFFGNFGAMRLLLSMLVIVGHTPELIDGNRTRELLTRAFGTLSLGEMAVTGFFLISGYLLTLSILSSPDVLSYFVKRVARIYPAFIVSSLVCLIVVAPIAGASFDLARVPVDLTRMLFLQPPGSRGAFAGAPYPALNGSTWTIAYEFSCYVLLAILFAIGALRRPSVILLGTGLLIGLLTARPHLDLARHTVTFGGDAQNALRFVSAFLTGVSFRLYAKVIWHSAWLAIASAVALFIAFHSRFLAEPALIVLGGYILFWFCDQEISPRISSIGQKTDLSYGIYLYAWPLQNLAIWKLGLRDPFMVTVIVTALSAAIAYPSWRFVERPSMQFAISIVRRRRPRQFTQPVMSVEDAGAP